jgi:hypothetical protein
MTGHDAIDATMGSEDTVSDKGVVADALLRERFGMGSYEASPRAKGGSS